MAKDDQVYLNHDYSYRNQMAPMTNDGHEHMAQPNPQQLIKTTVNQTVNQSIYPDGRKRATKACNACKQRHTRCGFERPCTRCVSLGYDCQDPPSKKRGSKKSDGRIEKHSKTKGFKQIPMMDKIGSFRQEGTPHIMSPFEFQMQLQQMAQQQMAQQHHNFGNMIFMPQSFEQSQMQFTQEDGTIYLNLSTDTISEVSNH